MEYSISEMKDLLLLTLQTYEEDLKKEPLTKEEIARINDWGKEKLDSIMEYHNNYLIQVDLDADRAIGNDWEHGDIGGY